MTETVLKSITRYNMLAPGARLAVAVSGGPDSVCLLHVLEELAPKLRLTLSIAHFNHKLRGAESDQDEQFVSQLAAGLDIPFYTTSAEPQRQAGNLEQSARRARRRFFTHLIHQGHVDLVALGHTRDDQAETVLFRLMRGSGLTGLAGVLPVTADGIVRPLIEVTRTQVLEFLQSRGIPSREDSSNQNPRFARNRIRHGLLPQLTAEWNPNLRESLAQLADLAYEEERVWQDIIDRLAAESFDTRGNGVEFACESIRRLPVALARRLIRRAIAEARGHLRGIEFQHVQSILELAGREEGDGRCRIPGLIAERSFEWIRLQERTAEEPLRDTELAVPGSYAIPGDNTIIKLELAGVERKPYPCGTLKAAEVDVRQAKAPLVLRGWRPGDHFWPLGDSRDRKLQELFQSARIPSWRRRIWPMISCGDKILWVRQFGPAKELSGGTGGDPVLRIIEVPAGI